MQNSKSFSIRHPNPDIFTSPFFSTEQIRKIQAACNFHANLAIAAVDLAVLKSGGDSEIKKLSEFYLNLFEREKFNSFKLSKRKIEWLGGRIAAKEAILSFLPGDTARPAWHNIQISADAAGRPFGKLTDSETVPMPDISITHSGSIAAALAATSFCGIDLQKIGTAVAKVKSRFATPMEQHILLEANPDISETISLAMLWSAKESVRKAFPCQPLPGFLELKLEKFASGADNFIGQLSCQRQDMPVKIPFYCVKFGGYAGAVILR
jgi:phosphopantetheinyl transferase (holo-ACP synthase)